LVRQFNQLFPLTSPAKPENLTKHKNFIQKTEEASIQFSVQKTLFLWKKGKTINQIAELRGIKEATVWQHFANLIEFNQLSVWKLLPKEKIKAILAGIHSERDTFKDIKGRLENISVSYDEIDCVLAYVKSKNRAKNILYHVNWYQKVHCLRKCYFDKKQRSECSGKFDTIIFCNSSLKMKRKDFIAFFNNYLSICILPNKEKESYISWDKFQLIKLHFLKKNGGLSQSIR